MKIATEQSLASRTAWALFATALAAYMLLSGATLLRLGVPYIAPYGSPPTKIHPGSYLLVMACAAALVSRGNPLRVLASQFARQPLLAIYAALMAVLLAWVVYRHGTARAGSVFESMWTPVFAALTVGLLSPPRRRQALALVMLLLGANSLLAIVEALTKTQLVPLLDERGEIFEDAFFRATALFGHPLHNALVTVSMLPAVTLLRWPALCRVGLGLALVLASLAFGGRASLALGLVIYGSCSTVYLLGSALRGHYTYLQLTGGGLAAMLGLTALAGGVMASGLGERAFQNIALDGSALVRLRVWEIFGHVAAEGLWFGVPPAGIDQLSLRIGLDPRSEAIENFWIYLSLLFGVVGFVPFVLGLGCLTLLMWRAATPAMCAAIVFYMVSASTGNTLATKTPTLMLLTVVVLCGSVTAARATPSAPEVARRVCAQARRSFAETRPYAPMPPGGAA